MSISVSDGNQKYHLSFNEELNNLEFGCVEDEDEDEEKKISINLTNILNVKLMKFEMEEIIRNQNLNQEINKKINKFQLTPVIFKIFFKNDNKLDNLTLISDNKSWSKFSILNNKIDNLFNHHQNNQQSINIILNPNSGQNNSNNLFISIIKPILISAQIQFNLFITKGVDDAGSIGRQILASKPGTRKTVMILGGDGTIHELLNGIILTSTSKSIIVDLIIM
jgi:diacylglycerol kinase family enzyme